MRRRLSKRHWKSNQKFSFRKKLQRTWTKKLSLHRMIQQEKKHRKTFTQHGDKTCVYLQQNQLVFLNTCNLWSEWANQKLSGWVNTFSVFVNKCHGVWCAVDRLSSWSCSTSQCSHVLVRLHARLVLRTEKEARKVRIQPKKATILWRQFASLGELNSLGVTFHSFWGPYMVEWASEVATKISGYFSDPANLSSQCKWTRSGNRPKWTKKNHKNLLPLQMEKQVSLSLFFFSRKFSDALSLYTSAYF